MADRLAKIIRVGDCVTLQGDLGAGKTTFVKRLINELTDDPVAVISPTFNLLQTYDVQLLSGDDATIWHYDLYRLESEDEIPELGLEDALANGVTLIEWPELVFDWLPTERISIVIEFAEGRNNRDVRFIASGKVEARLKQAELC